MHSYDDGTEARTVFMHDRGIHIIERGGDAPVSSSKNDYYLGSSWGTSYPA